MDQKIQFKFFMYLAIKNVEILYYRLHTWVEEKVKSLSENTIAIKKYQKN